MESGFAKRLADTDQDVRDKAIKTLGKWLKKQGDSLDYQEYLKLWKGLFYSVWMADKPKYQHELCEKLAQLATALPAEIEARFEDEEAAEGEEATEMPAQPPAMLYIRAFWETICREWRGIDRLRLNKYYYLMKQFIAVGFELVRTADFDREFTCMYFEILHDLPLNMGNDQIPAGIKLHLIENYAPMLRSLGELFDSGLSMILLSPLFEAMATTKDKVILKALEEAFVSLVAHRKAQEEQEAASEAGEMMQMDSNGEEAESGDDEELDSNGEETDSNGESTDESEDSEARGAAGCGDGGCPDAACGDAQCADAQCDDAHCEDAHCGESDFSDEQEIDDCFELGFMSDGLFQLGADPETCGATRKICYRLSELFKPYHSDECDEEGSCCDGGASDMDGSDEAPELVDV